MIKHYKNTKTAIDKATAHLIESRNILRSLSTTERKKILLTDFIKAFKPQLTPINLISTCNLILTKLFDYEKPLKGSFDRQSQLEIYKSELIRLKRITTNRDVPTNIKRLLAREFLGNLNGSCSHAAIPPYELVQGEENIFFFETENFVNGILSKNFKKSKTTTEIPGDILNDIFKTPFYTPDLKELLIKGLNPENHFTKNLKESIDLPSLIFKHPYSLGKKIRQGAVLEEYLILASFYNLPKIMKEAEPQKKILPYYYTPIIKTILKASHPKDKMSESSIRDDITELFKDSTLS